MEISISVPQSGVSMLILRHERDLPSDRFEAHDVCDVGDEMCAIHGETADREGW